MNSYKKVKAAAKQITSDSGDLSRIIYKTMKIIADTVGATLGPAGRPVLIERQEYGLPNIFTKDGVTVFRGLGFRNPTEQAIMESARDAANRTVTEAGDGTTTATVLAFSLIDKLLHFKQMQTNYTPQRVVRYINDFFKNEVEPFIKKNAITQEQVEDFGEILKNVATVSANGDKELADVVMSAFDASGNKGAIVLSEESGPSGYVVEQVKGFPVEIGYEESLGRYGLLFINDKANNRIVLKDPVFVLSQAPVTEIQTVQLLLEKIGRAWSKPESEGVEKFTHNVVLVAPGFSDSVIGLLSANWQAEDTINVLPMICPKTIIQNSEMHFLDDLSAVTGAKVFNPITAPVANGTLQDVGYGITSVEMSRFKTIIIGQCEQGLIDAQVQTLSATNSESILDNQIIQDRIARLSGGICKLRIKAPSSAELREKRDRAEDAIAAVRGAIKHGVLPGGCFTLLSLATLNIDNPIYKEVISEALLYPFVKILVNAGYTENEITAVVTSYLDRILNGENVCYDVVKGDFVAPEETGLFDSAPAVLEAIRNSFSIASNLGTIGGIIVFERDEQLEREEASATNHFLQSTDLNGKL